MGTGDGDSKAIMIPDRYKRTGVMKRIIIIAAVMLMTVSAYAQSGKDIYNRYSGKKGVSAVYISPTMFGLMKELPDIQVEAGEVNLSSVIRTFDGMYILEVEDRALSDSLEAEISGLVGQGRFELLMEAAEESEQMRIYIVRKDDVVTDFLMLAHDSGSTSVISISGNMPMQELQKILSDAVE